MKYYITNDGRGAVVRAANKKKAAELLNLTMAELTIFKPGSGGARPGSGRKEIQETRKRITFSVRPDLVPAVKKAVKNITSGKQGGYLLPPSFNELPKDSQHILLDILNSNYGII